MTVAGFFVPCGLQPKKMNILKTIFALVLVIGTLSSPRAEAIDQEVLFGGYAYTLRNLDTSGMILAYRIWLTKSEAEEKKMKFSLIYPRPIVIGFEARGGRLHKPDAGWEAELTLDFKYEIDFTWDFGAFIFLAGGGSYSDIDYTNVPTHYNFVTRGGVGLRLERLFFQTAYEHRSNGHLRPSNRGMDAITASVGVRF